MPETLNGRELVKNYLEENDIERESMAKMFGVSKQYLGEVLNGRKTGKKPNELILKIIQEFGI
ncbi:XRE family transcriptional regulator [Pediococcus acidilactici]|uniref:XRE family transcriptional regulator n=1 Tax=Pediococcus acidilactici TaxID=1254 RepID=UPI003F278B81